MLSVPTFEIAIMKMLGQGNFCMYDSWRPTLTSSREPKRRQLMMEVLGGLLLSLPFKQLTELHCHHHHHHRPSYCTKPSAHSVHCAQSIRPLYIYKMCYWQIDHLIIRLTVILWYFSVLKTHLVGCSPLKKGNSILTMRPCNCIPPLREGFLLDRGCSDC